MEHGDLKVVHNLFEEALKKVQNTEDLAVLEDRFFSRASGAVTKLMNQLGKLPEAERKQFGREINELKQELQKKIDAKRESFANVRWSTLAQAERIDATQPLLTTSAQGHIHPMSQALHELDDVCRAMGFLVEDGPELESDYYNFTAVNMPPAHPARDTQDTFYIQGHPNWLMRTHTSNMQVRLMKKYGTPLRAAYPGRCFRNEATDARHEHTFYQFEAIMVDRGITFAHMLGVIKEIFKGLYKKDVDVRLRPKHYPFVEPGVNGEVTCLLCDGKGCRVCKHTGWLEVFGAGLVHPEVLKAGGIDAKKWSGFAFGMGLTRMVMLQYGIEDVRALQSSDIRFLRQF